ncbi:hypothetical protein F5884DRAFT_879579 [Xylogone sp. PMI_703]|nr:hypothetical protein F5884DRAFT_879579 [Xylogone sp. PMI_703]
MDRFETRPPTSPALKGDSNFEQARYSRASGNADKQTWRQERSIVRFTIFGTIDPDISVYHRLTRAGWNPKERNPKVTYDTIVTAVHRITHDTTIILLREFSSMTVGKYGSFAKFHQELQSLKRKLQMANCMTDKIAVISALAAIKDDYSQQYHDLCKKLYDDKLTWDILVDTFNTIAANEQSSSAH